MAIVTGDMQAVGVAGWWTNSDTETPSAPAAPTLSVANGGTGTTATATVAGDAAMTHRVYWRPTSGTAWTLGGSRVGDGTIAVTGLPTARAQFIAISLNGDTISLPSVPVEVAIAGTQASALDWWDAVYEAYLTDTGATGSYTLTGGRAYRTMAPEGTRTPFIEFSLAEGERNPIFGGGDVTVADLTIDIWDRHNRQAMTTSAAWAVYSALRTLLTNRVFALASDTAIILRERGVPTEESDEEYVHVSGRWAFEVQRS